MIKKIISSLLAIMMVFGLSVSIIHAEKESEFSRLQNFIKNHPDGGTFVMEDDMLMKEDYLDDTDVLYTNHQTYTIETNQHQIVMENMEITNASEDDGWWSEEIYMMPSLIIKGDASKKPLVRIESNDWQNYQWTGVQIYASNGPALEIVNDDTGISGDEMMLTKISSTGDNVSTILISDDVKVTNLSNMIVSASGNKATAIERNNSASDFELSVSYSILKVDGQQAAAFKNIIDQSIDDGGNINNSEMKIEDVNGNCDYEKWQITSDITMKPIEITSDLAFEDLPLPVYKSLEILRDDSYSQADVYITYDKQAYEEGVASGLPFYLYPSFDALSSYILDFHEGDFAIFCELGEVANITGIPTLIHEEKFTIKIPRPYGASKIEVYASEDNTNWQYLTDQIDAMNTGNHSPYISLVINDVPIQARYLKVVMVGGYYDGKEALVEIGTLKDEYTQGNQNSDENITPPKDDLDDGDQGGNHGQGGGREEGNYESPSDEEKSPTNNETKPQKPDKPNGSLKPIEPMKKQEEKEQKEEVQSKEETQQIVKDTSRQGFITVQFLEVICLGLGMLMWKRYKA